jgi:hypothetical protein
VGASQWFTTGWDPGMDEGRLKSPSLQQKQTWYEPLPARVRLQAPIYSRITQKPFDLLDQVFSRVLTGVRVVVAEG